jgi:hypothetical protein
LTDVHKKNEMYGAYGTYGGEEGCKQGLVRRAEGRRPLGKPRFEWEDSLSMGLQEAG